MKGNFGRTRRISCLVVTGNKNGIAGFALAKSVETKAVLRKAKNRAGQKLMHIRRFKDHTGNFQGSLLIFFSKTHSNFLNRFF